MLAAFLASLVMAFLLGFFLEATIGMIGFWFLEVSSLLFVYMLFNFFFSGHMFPLDMLPGLLARRWSMIHAAAVPGLLPGGGVPGQGHRAGAGLRPVRCKLAWVVFFMFACRWAMNAGFRRYSGYGG